MTTVEHDRDVSWLPPEWRPEGGSWLAVEDDDDELLAEMAEARLERDRAAKAWLAGQGRPQRQGLMSQTERVQACAAASLPVIARQTEQRRAAPRQTRWLLGIGASYGTFSQVGTDSGSHLGLLRHGCFVSGLDSTFLLREHDPKYGRFADVPSGTLILHDTREALLFAAQLDSLKHCTALADISESICAGASVSYDHLEARVVPVSGYGPVTVVSRAVLREISFCRRPADRNTLCLTASQLADVDADAMMHLAHSRGDTRGYLRGKLAAWGKEMGLCS